MNFAALLNVSREIYILRSVSDKVSAALSAQRLRSGCGVSVQRCVSSNRRVNAVFFFFLRIRNGKAVTNCSQTQSVNWENGSDVKK